MKEITTNTPKIDRLITQIEMGEIKVPPLQRPFVWTADQIIELLESIYNDYPIGSILLWETNMPLPSARNIAGFKIPDKPENYPFSYVLDGQQRLSSLYGVFCKIREIDGGENGKYLVDQKIFDIVFLLKHKKFIHVSQLQKSNGNYIELKYLFDAPKFHDIIKNIPDDEKNVSVELLSRFSNYEVPIITTKKRELEEVGVIFERVNNTGTKLDIFDLMVAITWTADFHLQKEVDSIFNILKKKGFSKIKNKIILQCLSVLIEQSSGIKTIVKLNPDAIRKNINNLKQSLSLAVDYLSTELNVKSVDLLPHSHQIIGLCYFFSRQKKIDLVQKELINEWFWKSSFSQRYSAGTDSKIDEDIQIINKIIKSEKGSVKKLQFSITIEELQKTVFSRNNSFSRALLVLLSKNYPLDLSNGTLIDTGEALHSFNSKEYHHIFPKAFLRSQDCDSDFANSICNICLLPSGSNKLISDKKPSDYFFNIIPDNNYKDILDSNLIPVDKQIYKHNNYSSFLEKRAKAILDFIHKQTKH